MALKYILLFIVLSILILCCFFYFALRNKKQDVSLEKPFVEFINTKLFTKKSCVLARNPGFPVKDSHPYVIEDGTGWRIEDLEVIKEIPLESILTIQSVELQKGGVSGSTICYLFGTIVLDNEDFPFSISWGSQNSLSNDNWVFLQSFWQEQGYEQEFNLPEL